MTAAAIRMKNPISFLHLSIIVYPLAAQSRRGAFEEAPVLRLTAFIPIIYGIQGTGNTAVRKNPYKIRPP